MVFAGVIIQIFIAAIASTILGLVLMWGCKGVAGFKADYGKAYQACFIAMTVGIILSAVWNQLSLVSHVREASGGLFVPIVLALMFLVFSLLVESGIYRRILCGVQGERLSWSDAVQVTLFKLIVSCMFGIALIVGFFLWMIAMIALAMALAN